MGDVDPIQIPISHEEQVLEMIRTELRNLQGSRVSAPGYARLTIQASAEGWFVQFRYDCPMSAVQMGATRPSLRDAIDALKSEPDEQNPVLQP